VLRERGKKKKKRVKKKKKHDKKRRLTGTAENVGIGGKVWPTKVPKPHVLSLTALAS